MGRCRDCEWWRDTDEDTGFGVCKLTRSNAWGIPESKTLAYADSDHDGPNHLVTAPGFGCVQFMTREA